MRIVPAASFASFLWVFASGFAGADSTIDPANSNAYSANAGWIDFRPSAADGVVVTEFFLSGWAYSGNIGWIHFGNGAPANGWSYSQASASDFGVNNDGLGHLSGYAWSANAGWIDFGWGASSDPNAPRFNLLSGRFAGYAYAANAGWIGLDTSTTNLVTTSIAAPDSDGDGIADAWEWRHFGGLAAADAVSDADGDGFIDACEWAHDTDPNDPFDFLQLNSVAVFPPAQAGGSEQALVSFASNPTRRYRIETSTDLQLWSDSGLGEILPDLLVSETTRVIFYPVSQRRFYRVLAVRPLAP